jgi:murein DD-endopeptidase MepM/ murein hydrolase activator NlpD
VARAVGAYDSGDKSFGLSVLLQMKGAGVVRYAHLQTYMVGTGDKVLAGQEIGLTDNTGLSTGAHLHFELAPDGKFASNKSKVDPAPLIQDRPLTWHLTANAVYERQSLMPGIVNESRLQLKAEVIC